MLEYLYQRIVVDNIRKGISLSELPEEELKSLLNVTAIKSVDANTLEVLYKSLIDELVESYGFLRSLVLLTTVQNEAIDLQPRYKMKRLSSDLGLLCSAANILYKKIENYYLPDINYKLYVYLWKLHLGNFDEVEFFKKIEDCSIDVEDFLGKNPKTAQEQDAFYEIKPKKEESPFEPIKRSFDTRDKINREIQKRIRSAYTAEELNTYLAELIDKLIVEPTPERLTIVKLIFKAEKELSSLPPKRKKTNPDQISLF